MEDVRVEIIPDIIAFGRGNYKNKKSAEVEELPENNDEDIFVMDKKTAPKAKQSSPPVRPSGHLPPKEPFANLKYAPGSPFVSSANHTQNNPESSNPYTEETGEDQYSQIHNIPEDSAILPPILSSASTWSKVTKYLTIFLAVILIILVVYMIYSYIVGDSVPTHGDMLSHNLSPEFIQQMNPPQTPTESAPQASSESAPQAPLQPANANAGPPSLSAQDLPITQLGSQLGSHTQAPLNKPLNPFAEVDSGVNDTTDYQAERRQILSKICNAANAQESSGDGSQIIIDPTNYMNKELEITEEFDTEFGLTPSSELNTLDYEKKTSMFSVNNFMPNDSDDEE